MNWIYAYRKQASMITYHLWKKEIQIFAKVLRWNAPSHSNVSNTGLKSPVSKRSKNNKDNSSFFYRLTVGSLSSEAARPGCKFQPSWIILYRKRRSSTAEKFYTATICICPNYALCWPTLAWARYLWVRTEENSKIHL